MSFDLDKIWKDKREFRRRLAARPIAEKLRMLDALQERALELGTPRHGKTKQLSTGVVREKSSRYGVSNERK
jgi:hypothetical protein